jgi:hypothetical protein
MGRPPANAGAPAIREGYAGSAPGQVKDVTLTKRISAGGARAYSNSAPAPVG